MMASVVSVLVLVAVAVRAASVSDKPARVPWTTSRLTGSPDPPLPFRLERAFPKIGFTNLVDIPGRLHGLLPEGAGAMEPGVFQRSAPGWLTGDLHGTCDDPRELATGEED